MKKAHFQIPSHDTIEYLYIHSLNYVMLLANKPQSQGSGAVAYNILFIQKVLEVSKYISDNNIYLYILPYSNLSPFSLGQTLLHTYFCYKLVAEFKSQD